MGTQIRTCMQESKQAGKLHASYLTSNSLSLSRLSSPSLTSTHAGGGGQARHDAQRGLEAIQSISKASSAVQSRSSTAHPALSDSRDHVTWHPGLRSPGGTTGPSCGTSSREQATQSDKSWGPGGSDVRQAAGFLLLGEAYRAQPDHPDQNLLEAVKVTSPASSASSFSSFF